MAQIESISLSALKALVAIEKFVFGESAHFVARFRFQACFSVQCDSKLLRATQSESNKTTQTSVGHVENERNTSDRAEEEKQRQNIRSFCTTVKMFGLQFAFIKTR